MCVCVERQPWVTHMAAICEASAVELGREKVLREKDGIRERERENTWSEGSQKCPVQLAGMYLLCFIDGLMFCKTRGTTVFCGLPWLFRLVVSKRRCVTREKV